MEIKDCYDAKAVSVLHYTEEVISSCSILAGRKLVFRSALCDDLCSILHSVILFINDSGFDIELHQLLLFRIFGLCI